MSDIFKFDPEKLEEETKAADSQKRWLNAFGGAADSLANVKSAAHYVLGANPNKVDAGVGLRSAAESIRDPAARQAKLYEQYKNAREAKTMAGQDEALAKQKDPNSTQSKAAKMMASKYGIDVTPEMSAYDVAQLIDTKELANAEARSRVSMGNEKELARYKSGLENNQLAEKMRLERLLGGPKKQFEMLPIENQKEIEALSGSNAKKKAIANQIKAVMANWDGLSEEQKIVKGRSLLKTLNSSEGADAIGAEESKRLGGLLEYQMFNLTNPGKMFGRDVEGFATQARSTAKDLDDAVGRNSGEIDRLYGRQGAQTRDIVMTPNNKTVSIDPQAAKAETGPHGKSIKQNGVQYDWNPETGKYE